MAKRMNGEGSVRQRTKGGMWELRLMDGHQEDGRPRIITFYGKTQKEVKEKRDAYKKDRDDGIDLTADYTFEEWADIWFDHHKETISEVTQESYRYTLRNLKEHFKGRKLRNIKSMDIESFLRKLQREGRADSSVSQHRGMLFQIFNKAEANDVLRKNPVRFAEKMRSSKKKKRKESFTAEEVILLMKNLPTDRIGLSIRLMLSTGMRGQEMLGLRKRNVAADGSEIHIVEAVKQVKGTVLVGSTKTATSTRVVPVPHNLREPLKQLCAMSKDFIWESPKRPGQPCNPSHFRDAFKEAVSNVEGVRVLTPHCCRHTYVSMMQALGVAMETIRDLCGHVEIDMTAHYLHIQQSVREAAVRKFSDAYIPTQNTLDSLD